MSNSHHCLPETRHEVGLSLLRQRDCGLSKIVIGLVVTGDTDMSKIFVIALLTTAVAVSACRREMPHPNGLGASDVPAPQKVVK